jgi:beta-lactamase class D
MRIGRIFLFLFPLSVLLFSCSNPRIKEKEEWNKFFDAEGVKNGAFILRDNNHESVFYNNKDRCTERIMPASTFKIFLSLVAIETGIAPDDQMIIKWNGTPSGKPEWDKDLNLREAFKVSSEPYFKELARRIGTASMKHYLDTVHYGNANVNGAIENLWTDDTLKITADEQLGFVKRLYFNELPFTERAQRIVRSMMLHEDAAGYKLYYKTGWGSLPDKNILWIVGFAEKIVKVNEPKESMNKSGERAYPYFFAQKFEIPANDTTKDWSMVRVRILKNILNDYAGQFIK